MYVKIAEMPFAKGSLRYVHYMIECDAHGNILNSYDGKHLYVAKFIGNEENHSDSYFRDVEMQQYCNIFAKKFNLYKPPRKVNFVQVM